MPEISRGKHSFLGFTSIHHCLTWTENGWHILWEWFGVRYCLILSLKLLHDWRGTTARHCILHTGVAVWQYSNWKFTWCRLCGRVANQNWYGRSHIGYRILLIQNAMYGSLCNRDGGCCNGAFEVWDRGGTGCLGRKWLQIVREGLCRNLMRCCRSCGRANCCWFVFDTVWYRLHWNFARWCGVNRCCW